MSKRFAALHPALQLLIYGFLLGSTLFLEHPASLLLGWLTALLALRPLRRRGPKEGFKTIFLPLFFALPTALINALLRHYGMYKLFMLPWGRAFTLEALIDGAQAGFRLGLAFLWFRHLHLYLETDRLLYLFARLPNFALLLTLVLRFLPRFSREARSLAAVQKLRYAEAEVSLKQKFRLQSELMGGLSGWGLESSIRTADAMLARGLGLPIKPQHYKRYRWRTEDSIVLALFLTLLLASGLLLSGPYLKASFNPFLYLPAWGPMDVLAFSLTGLLSALPFIIDFGGTLQWHISKRKI